MAIDTKAAAKAKKIKAPKEYNFTWQALDKKGSRVEGVMQSGSEIFVRSQLRKQGLNPVKIKKKGRANAKNKAIKGQDIAIFSRQLSTMLRAGVPLVQGLDIISKGNANPSVGRLVSEIKASIESGSSLAESLSRYPKYFDDLFVNLVDAGERSGALETLLDKIATYKEKTESIKKKVKKALTYPTAVLIVAVIVTGILLYFVVPQFKTLFDGFGADLPAFTKMVVAFSEFVQHKWWVVLGGMVGFFFAYKNLHQRSLAFRRFQDRMMIKMPVVGVIIYKAAVARFARTLATMFAAGVPLVDAMESVAKASGNIVFEEAILKMRDSVATGQQLQLTMQQSGVFPPMATQMVGIGEESGALDTMCSKVAEFYEEDVDAAVDSLSSLLEPMIMVILGVLVGGLVVAMYLPIFKLGTAI